MEDWTMLNEIPADDAAKVKRESAAFNVLTRILDLLPKLTVGVCALGVILLVISFAMAFTTGCIYAIVSVDLLWKIGSICVIVSMLMVSAKSLVVYPAILTVCRNMFAMSLCERIGILGERDARKFAFVERYVSCMARSYVWAAIVTIAAALLVFGFLMNLHAGPSTYARAYIIPMLIVWLGPSMLQRAIYGATCRDLMNEDPDFYWKCAHRFEDTIRQSV